MRLRSGAALIAILLVASGIGVRSANAAASLSTASAVTAFSYVSAPGDFIGSGTADLFVPSASTRFALQGTQGFVRLTIQMVGSGTLTNDWSVDLAAPLGSHLVPGTYTDVQRATFRDPGHPGLDVSGFFRGCNTVFGSFVIRAIGAASDGTVNMLDASFTQNCESPTAPVLSGVVKYNAPERSDLITLTSSNPVTVPREPVTFTAGVQVGFSGAVTFFDGDQLIGTVVPDDNGLANLESTTLAAGTHSITAKFNGATSSPIVQTVRDNSISLWFSSGARNGPLEGAIASYARPQDAIRIALTEKSVVYSGLNFVWNAQFGPESQPLQAGHTYPFLHINGGGACTNFGGAFTVEQLRTDSSGNINLLDITFVAQCEFLAASPIIGELHYKPTPPDAPTHVVAAIVNKRINVTWSEPALDGERPIYAYTVVMSPSGRTSTQPVSHPSTTFGNLTPGVYTFRVIAVNRVGHGPPSAPSNPITIAASPPGSKTVRAG